MPYDGRSPLKDVVRSVILGAAMISPAVLAACKDDGAPPATPEPTTVTVPTATTTTVSIADAPDAAPPTEIVRPRSNPDAPQMPTRGFSGAARVRRV